MLEFIAIQVTVWSLILTYGLVSFYLKQRKRRRRCYRVNRRSYRRVPGHFIYLVRCKGTDVYKIGRTGRLSKRLPELDNEYFGVEFVTAWKVFEILGSERTALEATKSFEYSLGNHKELRRMSSSDVEWFIDLTDQTLDGERYNYEISHS